MPAQTVSVLGGGSFGTIIANIVAQNGYRVNFWMRNKALVESGECNSRKPAVLAGLVPLHEGVFAYR